MPPRKPATPATPSAPPSIPAAAPAPARSEVKGSGTAKPRPTPITLTYDLIAKRAYEIYASRGYAPGNPDEDWREAERQLKAGL